MAANSHLQPSDLSAILIAMETQSTYVVKPVPTAVLIARFRVATFRQSARYEVELERRARAGDTESVRFLAALANERMGEDQ